MFQINIQDFIDLVLKAGSVSGLIAVVYQIHNNRLNRPSFKFTFEASHAEFYKMDKLDYCDYHFFGIFKNTSLNPNTIVRLYLTVWDSKKRSSVLRFGDGVKEMKDIVSNQLYTLPLRFEPKQAYRLNVIFPFPLTGTQDERLMRATQPLKLDSRFTLPKYRYEFLIEDINGNLFDYRNSTFSIDIINRWWTLPNFSKNPKRYFIEVIMLGVEFIKWRWEILIAYIGFYK